MKKTEKKAIMIRILQYLFKRIERGKKKGKQEGGGDVIVWLENKERGPSVPPQVSERRKRSKKGGKTYPVSEMG